MSKRYLRSVAIILFLILCINPAKRTDAEEMDGTTTITAQSLLQPTSGDYVDSVQVVPQQASAEQTTDTAEIQRRIAQIAAEQADRQLVIIGDSRTVGMESAVGQNKNIWSAKVGIGLSWMKSTGVPAVEANINSNTDVVILMGVNDVLSPSYTDKYIDYINEKADAWTALGAHVYYVSVNPMAYETRAYPGITNTAIETWNTKMQAGLSKNVRYIDTYTEMLGNVESRDGIHYFNSTYKEIYDLINQDIILDKLEQEKA